MITGDLKSKIDRIWDAFWSGGIANPTEVIEQMTYCVPKSEIADNDYDLSLNRYSLRRVLPN